MSKRQNVKHCPFRKFLQSGARNAHVRYEDATLYVRRSQRILEVETRDAVGCLDMAMVVRDSKRDNTTYREDVVSTGFMVRLMDAMSTAAQEVELSLWIENVMNPFLADWFLRQGYASMPNQYAACFFQKFHKG